ncbi:MAG: MBL fold metallo-hydrolase [Actinobacteria bacterium]|nr:MBL fold metallo-hydrolase [Actinomycetota bacterium]MCL6104249.1 MBL fold metallo-hydrolase [Actinomycetota bacterium]
MSDTEEDSIRDTLQFQNSQAEIHKVTVGPLDNNVYIVRCKQTGQAVLIDAANEDNRLLQLCNSLGVGKVVQTHGHWDHIQAVAAVRDAGLQVWIHREDARLLNNYDMILHDKMLIEVGNLKLETIHTPGHTPGSICFYLQESQFFFSGDTLFPGGPGSTNFEGGDFKTIIHSIENRIFSIFDGNTIVLPGHGKYTTIEDEAPHLKEWVNRGW